MRLLLRSLAIIGMALGMACATALNTPSCGLAQQPAPAQTGKPASVMFMVDTSTSAGNISRAARQTLSDALIRFVQNGDPANEYSLMDISTDPIITLDRKSDQKTVVEKIKKLFATDHGGATALYEGICLGAEKMGKATYTRRLIILISDGVDTASAKDSKSLQRCLVKAGVPVYTIYLKGRGQEERERQFGKKVMDAIATVSGAKSFSPASAAEVATTLESLLADLKQ
jgi:Mg-chelatase subunit ChlD